MSDIDPHEKPAVNWSELGVSKLLLPTEMVTLLLADVEGSTRLWETRPGEMVAAVERLDRILPEVVAKHGGVRPVDQGEGDSFVMAFGRASDALACALGLQRAPLAPIRLRIGVHPGEIQPLTMTPTTSARPSTAPHGCAAWPRADGPCCGGDRGASG